MNTKLTLNIDDNIIEEQNCMSRTTDLAFRN
jgi:hypothetical protein